MQALRVRQRGKLLLAEAGRAPRVDVERPLQPRRAVLLREPEAEIPVGFRLTPAEEFYGLKPLPDWFGSTWFAEALRATGHEV